MMIRVSATHSAADEPSPCPIGMLDLISKSSGGISCSRARKAKSSLRSSLQVMRIFSMSIFSKWSLYFPNNLILKLWSAARDFFKMISVFTSFRGKAIPGTE